MTEAQFARKNIITDLKTVIFLWIYYIPIYHHYMQVYLQKERGEDRNMERDKTSFVILWYILLFVNWNLRLLIFLRGVQS